MLIICMNKEFYGMVNMGPLDQHYLFGLLSLCILLEIWESEILKAV